MTPTWHSDDAPNPPPLGAAGSLITRPEILSRALLKGGTQQQKEHWLPKLAMVVRALHSTAREVLVASSRSCGSMADRWR